MQDPPLPPLRALEFLLFKSGSRQLVVPRDGLGYAPEEPFPLEFIVIGQLFDGVRPATEVQAEFARQTGQIIPGDLVSRIAEELDRRYLLDSDRFRGAIREWSESPVRPATHAGPGGYPDEKAALEREMAEIYRRPGAADPARPASTRPLRAILAPHIDFHRGGHIYTWAYQEVRRRESAPVYVVIGTGHKLERQFSVTGKSFDTPWGPVATDARFLSRLEALYGEGLRGDEFKHRDEHSIEFQVVFLRHALGVREFTIVPILSGGFHEAMHRGVEPEADPDVERFFAALTGAIASAREEGREVVLVGGVDFAHVGRSFGDEGSLTPEFLAEVRARDESLLEAAGRVDARGFHSILAGDGNRTRVCGAGPIYTILTVLGRSARNGGVRGEVLAYDQAVDRDKDLCVTFASMAFEDADGLRT
jgi:MEMO1 family protein